MIVSFLIMFFSLFGGKNASQSFVLFDFRRAGASVTGWVESSDTIRQEGKSKAALVIQETKKFNKAVLFTMLNPLPVSHACFAGMKYVDKWNLDGYKSLYLRVRGQGQNNRYNIVLRHKDQNNEPFPSYQQSFTAPDSQFGDVILSLDDFKPFYRGKELDSNVEPLDKTYISSFGIQMSSGLYEGEEQRFGVSSLEIDQIMVTKDIINGTKENGPLATFNVSNMHTVN